MSDFLNVNEGEFQKQVLESGTPVLVEFGAPWCQPCKRLEPILKQLGEQWGTRVRLVRVDVDEAVNLTMRYQVMGVPTVILFSGGVARERLSGFQQRERIVEKFEPFL